MATKLSLIDNLPANVRSIFDADALGDDLSHGVAGGFSILSFRGSKWRIKKGGEETLITDENDEAKASVEVIMLKASKFVSKVFYTDAYVEGSDQTPDCMSINGDVPDAGVPTAQNANCATCPQNEWGSKISPSGKKAKACQDSRRIAIVPAEDIANAEFNGPMLLRVPAASLGDLAQFGSKMAAKGFPYNAIVTRIGFDPDASYPKLTFKAARPLEPEQLEEVARHWEDADALSRILTEKVEVSAPPPKAVAAPAPVSVDTDFDADVATAEAAAPPVTVAAKPKAKPRAKAKPKAAPAPAPAPVEGGDELDNILADLNNLS